MTCVVGTSQVRARPVHYLLSAPFTSYCMSSSLILCITPPHRPRAYGYRQNKEKDTSHVILNIREFCCWVFTVRKTTSSSEHRPLLNTCGQKFLHQCYISPSLILYSSSLHKEMHSTKENRMWLTQTIFQSS